MDEQILTLEQGLCSIQIFLNALGLTLEQRRSVNENSIIKVFNSLHRQVGKVSFYEDKIIIKSITALGILNASYQIPKVSRFVDYEVSNAENIKWNNKIDYSIEKSVNEKFTGEFVLNCTMDSELGNSCTCLPILNYEIDGKNIMSLKLLRNGKMLEVAINKGSYYENINIMPHDNLNGFFRHDIIKNKIKEDGEIKKYRRYSGVFSNGRNSNQLHVFLEETFGDETIDFKNKWVTKVGDEKSQDLLIQKGELMQKLDPDMFYKIKLIKDLLTNKGVSLFDNFVGLCYGNFSDDQMKALLGIDKKKMKYQYYVDSLVKAYYSNFQIADFCMKEKKKK